MILPLCACGCGQRVRDKRSTYLRNHHNRNKPLVEGIDYDVVETGYESPCHLWRKCRNHLGYAKVSRNGVLMSAHVYVWEGGHGPVPEGLELDHLCRIRHCIRDDHLEPVTHAENLARAKDAKEAGQKRRRARERAERLAA